MNLPPPITLALEKAIDAVLRLDPETCERLASIDGCVVRVNITAPSLSLIVSVANGRVLLSQPDDADGTQQGVDTTISGSLSALRSLLDGNDAVYKGDVTIEGDIGVTQHIKHIIAQLDPDWQEAVSPWLGDSLTHRVDVTQSRLSGWLKRSRRSFDQNVSDYLQEEIELLAPNGEVEQFCREVDEIRAATDRLAARVQRLEAALVPETLEE